VVSGNKLGEMGDPFVFEYEGREIKFCCKGCLKDFKKEPAKYIKKIEEAEAKAKKAK
jgi:YHS domain-containing protein